MFNILLLSVLITPIVAGLVLLARERRRWRQVLTESDVCRQYVYLFRGGHVSESAIQSARVLLERLLASGDLRGVDAQFRPGKQFAVMTRALVEIGSEPAREALERQLERTFTTNALEQAWYRLDVARNLRQLNRLQSMPVLVLAAAGPEAPLSHFLAAEAASFPSFSGFMYQIDRPVGRAALVVLLRSLRGLRCGVEPRVVTAARLGEAVEILWDQRQAGIDPLLVRVFVEARRLVARAEHAERWFGDDEAGRTAFREQIERMASLVEIMGEYLEESTDELLQRLPNAGPAEQAEILQALMDLRADTSAVVIPLLEAGQIAEKELALESLVHVQDRPAVGTRLCHWLLRHVPPGRKIPSGFPYKAALRALRHFPSETAELLLLDALGRKNATVRLAALGSLGWWAPVRPGPVVTRLKEARFDHSPLVRQAAQAALARLGERQALRWFHQQLVSDHPESIHRAIQFIAEEGLLLLWPDLDMLADSDNGDIAFHACEALEQMRESLSFSSVPRP